MRWETRNGAEEGRADGSTDEKDVSDITAPSIGPDTTIEREPPEERLAKHEQSDVDAMGLDKRREVVGGSYGAQLRQAGDPLRRRARDRRRDHRRLHHPRRQARPAARDEIEDEAPWAQPTGRQTAALTAAVAPALPRPASPRASASGSAGSASTTSTGIRHRSDASRAIRAPSARCSGRRSPPPRRRSPRTGVSTSFSNRASSRGAVDRRRGPRRPPRPSPAASRRSRPPRSGRRPCRRDRGSATAPSIPAVPDRGQARLVAGRPRTCQPRSRPARRPARARGSRSRRSAPAPSALRGLVVGEHRARARAGQLGMRPGADRPRPRRPSGPGRSWVISAAPRRRRISFCASIICWTSSTSSCASSSNERVGFQSTRSAPLPG